MIRASALATVATLAMALPASAQSTMERLEAVAVEMNAMMFDAMVEQTPGLAGNMPSPQWSDGLRAAYVCMHDGFVAEAGTEAVSDMISDMEASLATTSPADPFAGGGSVENPAGISDERAVEIVSSCNMMDAFMEHLASSGALQILMEQ